VISTWRRGQELLCKHTDDIGLSEEDFLASLRRRQPARVRGSAIFVTRLSTRIPRALLHLLKHTKSLHERVVLLTVEISRQPRVEESRRLVAKRIAERFYRVIVTYGFMEQPDVPAALSDARKRGVLPELPDATYFLGRLTLQHGSRARLRWFPRGLFLFLFRNASQATAYLGIPAGRSVEIGEMVEI
jgi:KUP system potassium uptake protein